MDIVVFGGTFDPPHIGHQSIAVRFTAEGGKVVILPNRIPPHKSCVTSAAKRLDMCKLAFAGCEVSDMELTMPEPSYTYNTLMRLRSSLEDGQKLKYVIGADSMRDLSKWRNPQLLAQLTEFVVVPRAGYPKPSQYIEDFCAKYGGTFHLMPEGVEDISSSDARLLNTFGELGSVVSKPVEKYILKHGLYNEFKGIADRFCEFGITPSRKSHIKNVALTAVKLAKAHGCDQDAAIVAALLHDIAKYNDAISIRKWGVMVPGEVRAGLPAQCLHAEIGALVAERVFGISDDDIINAIRYHTTGREDMSLLEKIIFLADYIEPSRKGIEGLDEIRAVAETDIDKCMAMVIRSNLKYLLSSGKRPANITYAAAKFYGA